jgi:hypothetical protein
MYGDCCWENLLGSIYLEDQKGDERITSRWILERELADVSQ